MSDRQDLSQLEAYHIQNIEEKYGVKEKYQDKRHVTIRQGPDLTFLSQDAKVGLAMNSSIIAHPGAYSIDSQQSMRARNKPSTQAELLKLAEMNTTVSEVDGLDGRNPPPRDEGHDGYYSHDGDPLGDLFNRMRAFQRNYEAESKDIDEGIILLNTRRRQQLCWRFTVIGILLILVVVITLSVIFTTAKRGSTTMDESNQSGATNSENIPFPIDDCYNPSLTDQSRLDELRSILITQHSNLSNSINEPYSSASVALCWLCNYDGLNLMPVTDNALRILERFVLASLYFSFVGNENFADAFNIFSSQNWLSSMDVCQWTLATCHESDSGDISVSGLELSLLDLSGQYIPSEIALLQNLTNLRLYPRDMLGPIPSKLWQLTKLEEFSLSILEEGGAMMNGLGNLTQLRLLLVKSNFKGNLPDMSRLLKLTQLEIYDSFSDVVTEFPDLHMLTNLESLAMHVPIDKSPSKIWNLTKLDSLQVRLYGATLPAEIQYLTNLQYLQLLQLSGTIPTVIGLLTRLTSFHILGENLLGTIPSEIGRLAKLEKMYFEDSDVVLSYPIPNEVCLLVTQGKLNLELGSSEVNPGCQ